LQQLVEAGFAEVREGTVALASVLLAEAGRAALPPEETERRARVLARALPARAGRLLLDAGDPAAALAAWCHHAESRVAAGAWPDAVGACLEAEARVPPEEHPEAARGLSAARAEAQLLAGEPAEALRLGD